MTALKALLFLILAPGMVAGYIPLGLLRRGLQIETGLFAWLALPLWLIGAAILLWSFWNFLAQGRGTPAPIDPPRELVAVGFYRYTRNPMYVGMLLALLAFSVVLASPASLLILPAFVVYMNRFQIVPEERELARNFGIEFQAYRARVRRWL